MLEQLVAKAEAMVAEQDKYVQTDWQQLVDALAQAQELLEDSGNALAGDVGEASNALLNAILAQRYKANKDILEDLLAEAETVDTTGASEAAVAAFRTALANAKAVMADATLSVDDQAKVDEAVAALQSAMDGLTAGGAPEATDHPQTTQKPDATQKPEGEKPAPTGDTNNVMVPVIVVVVCVVALVAVVVVARKRKH